jgi:hypothetical protein
MKKAVICLLCLGLSLFIYGKAVAELYKWVDEKGIIHISDYLPKYLKNHPNIITISDRKANFLSEDSAFITQDPQGKTHFKTQSTKTIRGDKTRKMEIYAEYDCPDGREVRISFPCGEVPLRDNEGEKNQSPAFRRR